MGDPISGDGRALAAIVARDVTGAETALAYTQSGQSLVAFSQGLDHTGRVRTQVGPDGSQTYAYDQRDRLVDVQDTYRGSCWSRRYGFDADSNRTSVGVFAPDSTGGCQDSTVLTTVTSGYDTGDRTTNGAYVHDALGRATKIAKADWAAAVISDSEFD